MNTRVMLGSAILLTTLVLFAGCGGGDSPSGPGNGGSTPNITSILPSGAAPGIPIQIKGANFDSAPGTVTVGGSAATVASWSPTEVACTIPQGLPQVIGISVELTTAAGKTAQSTIDITPPHTYRVTDTSAMDHYPCWSGGGDWIYFSSVLPGSSNWDIYRIPATGGVATRVTFDDEPDFYPDMNFSSGELAWSSQMTHVNNSDNDYEVFYGFPDCLQPGSGCTISMLTRNTSRDLDPAWARTVHAGYELAYTHEDTLPSGSFAAWKVWLHSNTGTVELTEGRQPGFSPDGTWVVFNHEDNIYKVPTTGGTPEQLTDTDHDWYPNWGPDDRIVFQRTNGATAEDIFVMNADGSGVAPMVNTPNYEYCPSWSPDGKKVVYYANVMGQFNIYVYVVP
ncbi:hypothetical protein FJ251_07865 [bacterium]|nr:hypothetical protein [bacterium]